MSGVYMSHRETRHSMLWRNRDELAITHDLIHDLTHDRAIVGPAVKSIPRHTLVVDFFPTGDPTEDAEDPSIPSASSPYGRVPVWGCADVLASRVPGIAEGQRIYG